MVEKKKDANKAKVAREISKIWGGLESDQIATLKEHVEITKYKKGEMIYQCDETPTDAMCLLTGKVKIFKDGINGKSQIIRVIKPNEFFGFRAYFANEIYKTAAQALDTCTVVHFPFPVLMKLLQKSYKIGYYFIKYLSVHPHALSLCIRRSDRNECQKDQNPQRRGNQENCKRIKAAA